MKKFFIILFGLIVAMLIGGCLNLGEFFPFLNRTPVITSEPITTATEDNPYSYQVEAIDSEGDTLTYSFTLKPEGMSINSESGLITWIPTNSQVGIHQVIVEVSDGKQSVTQSFEIEVVNVNNPPQIFSYFPINLNIEINEGDSVKFEVQAYDIDLNTTLDYKWYLDDKVVSNSSGAGAGTNSISSWKYSSEYGNYGLKTIKVLVSDGELEDSAQWKVTVNDITPPSPSKPTLNSVTSPTNISPQILSGTKEANTSIWANGLEAIPLDLSTEWSYSLELIEGENNISIVSRDSAGSESSPATAVIEYDLNIYVDAGNTNGIEDGTKTHPFNTITEGIDVVATGKSVIVSAGTYNEQLVVNKGITLQGAGKETTFINGTGLTGNLITLEADHITITGFAIDGENGTSVGIYLNGYSFININSNLIKNNNDYGISYSNSTPTIEDNNIESNSYSGIDIGIGGAGTIRNNILVSNQFGIRTCGNSSPEISNNNISNNSHTGIYCRESATPIISYNIISNSSYGILIDNVLGDSVNPDIGRENPLIGESASGNKITGNTNYGVWNKTSHKIKSENNWWGDTNGPKCPGNNSSSGDWAYWDNADGTIDFDPWLSTAP